jgi:hypothetical protein
MRTRHHPFKAVLIGVSPWRCLLPIFRSKTDETQRQVVAVLPAPVNHVLGLRCQASVRRHSPRAPDDTGGEQQLPSGQSVEPLCRAHTDAGMLVVAAQPGTPDPTGRHGRWLLRLRSGARYPPIAIIPAGRPDQAAAPNNGPMALSTSNYRSVRPSAAAGLRRQFAPARPPGLGGGHCALGLADVAAHESRGGSPVQGYKG